MLTRRATMIGAASTALKTGTVNARLYALFDALLADLGRPDALSGSAAPDRLRQVRAFDPNGLSPGARLDFDVVSSGLEVEARLATQFPFGAAPGRPFVLDPRTGAYLLAASGLARHDDAGAYLDALRRLALRINDETGRAEAAARDRRVLPPAALLAQTIARVRAAANTPGATSPLVVQAPVGVQDSALALVDGELRPGLARQADVLAGLAPLAAEASGAWRFRDGDAYYALTLRQGLGLDLSPHEVEAQAHDHVRRWSARIEPMLRAQGLKSGGVGERLRALMRDPSGLYPDSEAGRQAAVADMNAVLAGVRERLGAAFADVPAGRAEVRRMSMADEARGRAGYRETTADGGAYFVDLHDIRRRPVWTLPTVAVHETLPGHLLQIPIQAAAKPHPLRLRYSPCYFEGWAVYAETLAEQLGVLTPLGRIGFVQSMLMRSSRAVIDVGVHLRRWSPERARAELAAIYGDGLFNSLDAEVERVCLSPGTGGADAFAAETITSLRREHEAVSGERERAFHTAVLAKGAYPPHFLDRAVALALAST